MYCTEQDLIDRLGDAELIQLSNRIGTGMINSAVVEQAINDAGAEIDSYLTQQPTPMTVMTPRLVSITVDISIYYLNRGRDIEDVLTRYNAAISFVKRVNQGRASFGVDNVGAKAAVEQTIEVVDQKAKLFGRQR